MKKIMSVMLPALALSLAMPALAHADGDTGTGGSGNATLVGPVVAPVEDAAGAIAVLGSMIPEGPQG
ncbi:hypothetical protein [Streptomyces sp. st140]|uniref:hypothetical protein n=1 Tax=Streptomyces sp. st140 TaxID=1828052 RepID=UPI00117E0291|nr:hypothetical protein [Streptomyces sp. st140]